MILPDTTPSLVAAARRELLADPGFLDLLASAIGGTLADPWVWQEYEYADVRGKGVASVLLVDAGVWSTMNTHNTQEFPVLGIEIYADTPRTSELAPARRTAQDLARDVFTPIRRVFHRPDPGNVLWGVAAGPGALRVNRSVLNSGPTLVDVPDADGKVRLSASFAVSLG